MTSAKEPRARSPSWRAIAVLTLGMGIAVAVSWFAISLPFRLIDTFGLDLESMIRPRRLGIYTLQFAMVAAFGYLMARRWLAGTSVPHLAASLGLAWVLEGVVLTIIGEPLVANELDPQIAWHFWLVATAGPLQPAVAFLGGWLGLHHAAARRPRS